MRETEHQELVTSAWARAWWQERAWHTGGTPRNVVWCAHTVCVSRFRRHGGCEGLGAADNMVWSDHSGTMPQLHWEGQGWRHGGPDIALDSHNNPDLRYYCHSTDEKPALAKVHDLPTRHMAILWQHRQPRPWSAWRAFTHHAPSGLTYP